MPQLIADDKRFTEFANACNDYLELYGFRCVDELKLEEYSLKDRPHLIYQVIRNYLRLDNPPALDVEAISKLANSEFDGKPNSRHSPHCRSCPAYCLARRCSAGCSSKPGWVSKIAKICVSLEREFMVCYAKCSALWELISLTEGILSEADDIFYLTIDEMWDFVKGTAVTTDLRGLTRLRRAEFDGYRSEKMAPDDRFETYGMAYHRNLFRGTQAGLTQTPAGTLRGIGCCTGVTVGRVKVLQKPTDDVLLAGEILVAARMDPGWIPLFPAVSGILIERGSILSHSAVVAREMGIPTIVGIAGLVNAVQTDTRVRMDGRSGTVEILSGQPDLQRAETS